MTFKHRKTFGLDLTEIKTDTVFNTGDEIIYLQDSYYQKYRIGEFKPGASEFRLHYEGTGDERGFSTRKEDFGYYGYSVFRSGYYLLNEGVPYDPKQQGDRDDDI